MNVKVIVATATAALAAVVLTGCGASAGTVVSKVVEPESKYSTITYVNKIPITTWHTDDEDYCLNIKGTDGEKGYVCIDKERFDYLEEGDFYAPAE